MCCLKHTKGAEGVNVMLLYILYLATSWSGGSAYSMFELFPPLLSLGPPVLMRRLTADMCVHFSLVCDICTY